MNYDYYIFDMDGTILNTIEDLTDATNYTMQQMGYKTYEVKDVKRFVGNGLKTLLKRAMPAEATEDDMEKALFYFDKYYKVHCKDKTGPYPGIMNLLYDLRKAGKTLAVVSNKPDFAVKILASEVFSEVFNVAIGEHEGVNKKPARDMVDIALKELTGLDNISDEIRSKTVYIGDSNVDFETSVNSELDCVLVTWGFRDKEELVTYGAKYMVDKPEEILAI